MTLPHSLDYLNTGGVLDFDAAAYLNSTAGGVNYNTNMLGGTTLQNQPKKDSFASKAKAKLTDVNFLKKAATAAIVGTLVFFGIKNGKNLINNIKTTNWSEKAGNLLASAKNGISNLFSKVSK